jgi:hypothetical protein
MNDNIFNIPLDAARMGDISDATPAARSQQAQPTHPEITTRVTAQSDFGYSGDVIPSAVATMAADEATAQHLKFNAKIASIEAQLSEQVFDQKTGKPLGFKVEGRDRFVLEMQRNQFVGELQYLGQRALEQLPQRAEHNAAIDDGIIAGVQRERNISAMANTLDASGKPIGRLQAMRLVDEAAKRSLAEKLVGSN